MRGSPDLLSILASDKDAGVAAVATKAEAYARDVERLRYMADHDDPAAVTWRELAFAYGIVVRELRTVAQDLKEGTR